jgi:UDP-3-O-[3-hydroxymyristoyl] glucosamine N-acyltransferase
MKHRNRFFNKKFEFLTLAQIIEITGAVPFQTVDLEQKFYDVATIDAASKNDISFINSGTYLDKLLISQAGVCFLEEKYAPKAHAGICALIHKNPYFAYAQIASALYEERLPQFSSTLIHPTAQIGENSLIAPNSYIGSNVIMGKNCYVGPNASIMDGTIIGDNCFIHASAVVSFTIMGNDCIIHNGAKIGQDGFGFAHDKGVNHKIIQLGIVEIGNLVEIGANSCVDRGAIDNTKIGNDVKIDNLNQIAHNVTIGQGTVMAGGSGIAGSAKIGKFVQIGGQSSIAGHIEIGDGVKMAARSGVMRSVDPMEVIAGAPSMPIREWHKMTSKIMKLGTAKAE